MRKLIAIALLLVAIPSVRAQEVRTDIEIAVTTEQVQQHYILLHA